MPTKDIAACGSSRADGTSANSSTTDLQDLLAWLRSVGIWWDESLVDIKAGCSSCSGPNLGVFAVSDISENQLLCVIPRSAILSPRTTSLAAVLEQERLGGGLALTIAVMYEASLGQTSKWAGYLASLPCCEYLPLFWTDAELELLQGTSLEGKALADRQDTQEDYEQHVVPLLQKYPEATSHFTPHPSPSHLSGLSRPERCSLDHFRTAASWVASRCFFVDDWHGDAMVPLADIFNHKASVVLLGDAWGVAELADTHQDDNHHHHNDDDDDSSQGDDPHDDSSQHDDSSSQSGSENVDDSGSEGGDGEAGSSEGGGSSEDAQHGFAVGGMPIIKTGERPTGGGANGVQDSSGVAGRWHRDGINLRLEIGICSMGPPDDRTLPSPPAGVGQQTPQHDTPAAAAAAAAGPAGSPATAATEDTCGQGPADSEQQQPLAKRRKVVGSSCGQAAGPCSSDQQQQEQLQVQPWPDTRLEIVAASCIPAGAEVHNTYGELSNAQLVSKYGFCLPHNPFDELQLCDSWSGFILGGEGGSSGFKAPQELKQYVKWLQQHSNLLDEPGEDEEAPEPPTVTPGGRLNLMTAAVVRLLGTKPAELKGWQGLEDVLQNPDSHTDDDEAPAAVPVGNAAAAAAAAGEEAAAVLSAAEGQVVSQQFDDIKISQHDVSWWGKAGLELLVAAVQRRLQQYPASLNEDRLALQEQQQGHGAAGEHAAAAIAALQLRVCEQQALHQVLQQAQELLGS